MRIFIVVLSMMLFGCAATYKQNVLSDAGIKLIKGKSVSIATPANGSYDNKEYAASGKMTAQATRTAFTRFSNTITISSACADLACLQKTGSKADYYVIPEILHWEDRATEWSGIPDRIEIKLAIYDGKSAHALATSLIIGKSKWATFGGDHPQDLLEKPLNAYIQSLY
jgi:hypothetical protein